MRLEDLERDIRRFSSSVSIHAGWWLCGGEEDGDWMGSMAMVGDEAVETFGCVFGCGVVIVLGWIGMGSGWGCGCRLCCVYCSLFVCGGGGSTEQET